MGEWRNWQTRYVQVVVPARAWRFKSSPAHQGFLTYLSIKIRLVDFGYAKPPVQDLDGGNLLPFLLWSPLQCRESLA